MGSSTPVSRVVHYRHRTDTGAIDASPTWGAAEDTSFEATVGTNYRTRACVENTGTAADTITTPLFSRCGYADNNYATWANVLNGADASSSADAANITVQRLTSATGTFASATAGYDENEALSVSITNAFFTEVEWAWVLSGGAGASGVGGGETWTATVQGLTNAPAVTITWTTPEATGTDFQPGNQLGGAGQAVANSASIAMTTAAVAEAGKLAVVVVGCDNNGTTDADFSEISSIDDSAGGNVWTKAVEWTNGQGAAQAGCTVSIWYSVLANQIDSSGTITANITNPTTSGDALTISARCFTVAAGKTVSVEATNVIADDNTIGGSSLDATTSNIECLRIRALSSENTSTATAGVAAAWEASDKDWSIWWTANAIDRFGGGTAATANRLFVEGTISTGTGDASLPITPDGAGRDHVSAYVAFKAVTADTYTLMGASTL
jgi:hypothetical protein